MKIELTPQQMQTILAAGLLHPSDIACLDIETRNQLKTLCLKMCQPSNCARCEMHGLCQQAYSSSNAKTLSQTHQAISVSRPAEMKVLNSLNNSSH
ncbi:MAG: hypothetical protein JXK16_11545 [Thiotrichales bacterium]|nr:hypothetical protein [Thiotrichales bacterium]